LGADAVLLIVKVLGEKLSEFLDLSRELGLEALVEVTTEEEIELARSAGARLIGVNNRDLETLEVDLARTERLAPLIPGYATLVSESGISSPEDVRRMLNAGADSVLVGTALMRARNLEQKVRELVEARS
jgi:indole-3-glycerol phosphate synthase